MLDLNGHLLSTWQRGRRRYAIEQQYRYLPWHPTNLFSTVMRRAIVQLSMGLDRQKVASQAVSLFTAQCTQPGLDVRYGTDTYTLAMDFCATIKTVLAYLERITLVVLHEVEPIEPLTLKHLNGQDIQVRWSFLAHADESGLLHRWVFVDQIDEEAILKELHKWEVIGDIIVHGGPMLLHVVAIGRTISGRRYSPWCRAFKSPVIANLIRFNRKTGRRGQLTEGWTPIYLADNPKNDPDQWLDQMIADDAHEPLMMHKTVGEPSKTHIDSFFRDLKYESDQIRSADLADPFQLPMCRTSCDVPYICPHQLVCYSATATVENSGLYERIGVSLSTPTVPNTRTVIAPSAAR